MRIWMAILASGAALWAQAPDYSLPFAQVFRSVLESENPDSGQWGDTSQYLEAAAMRPAELGPMSDRYRVIVVPGFMSACTAFAPIFSEGRRHLREKHGLDVDVLQVPNDGSEANGKFIADYLRQKARSGGKRYIAIGHSKGAVDLEAALQDRTVASSVAALISVAGAIGGSPLADAVPGGMDGFIAMLPPLGCTGDLAAASRSLNRGERRAFLTRHPNAPVPSYSLVAVSGRANTSKALVQTWLLLSFFGSRQDGQLLAKDSVLPGAKYLGAALADHVAVASSFDKTIGLSRMFDHGHYPRAALIEALVRFAIADLEGR
jgi:hypothetical protein